MSENYGLEGQMANYAASKAKIQQFINEKDGRISSYLPSVERVSVVSSIDHRRKELENTAFEQDIHLKKMTLVILFSFLSLETAVIFLVSFFQAFAFHGFALEEWSFKLLVAATITQITAMLLIAVKHLFPQRSFR